MARYRVLEGAHSEHGKLYKKGDIVESEADLLRLNRSTPPKFARLDASGEEVVRPVRQRKPVETDDQIQELNAPDAAGPESAKSKPEGKPTREPQDGYDDLSDNDLREIAEAEEVPLRGDESRQELIQLLRDV